VTNSSCNKYYSPWQYLVLIPDDDEYSVVQRLEFCQRNAGGPPGFNHPEPPNQSRHYSSLSLMMMMMMMRVDTGPWVPSTYTTRPATVISIHHHDICAELDRGGSEKPSLFF
jgi:hypothetical protein